MTKQAIKTLLHAHAAIFTKYHVNKVGLFGSYRHNKARKNSDVDLLVEFDSYIDLFDFVHFVNELKAVLKTNVDVATPDSLKPYIRPKIMQEVEWVW